MIDIPPYVWKFIIGGIFLVLGGVAPFIIKSGWDDYSDTPNIQFRRVAFFWVESEKGVYQIGALIKLFNLGTKPYLVNGIALDAVKPTFYGRGVTYLQEMLVTGTHAKITDDNFMKPASEASFKMLLPIKLEANIVHPPPLGIVDVGQWMLVLQKSTPPIEPDFYGTFDRVISRDEWASLSKAAPTIDVDSISFQRLPPRVSDSTPVSDFVLYSPDRSATFDVFGYAQTPYARSEHGTIVYVRGKGIPPLDGGWAS